MKQDVPQIHIRSIDSCVSSKDSYSRQTDLPRKGGQRFQQLSVPLSQRSRAIPDLPHKWKLVRLTTRPILRHGPIGKVRAGVLCGAQRRGCERAMTRAVLYDQLRTSESLCNNPGVFEGRDGISGVGEHQERMGGVLGAEGPIVGPLRWHLPVFATQGYPSENGCEERRELDELLEILRKVEVGVGVLGLIATSDSVEGFGIRLSPRKRRGGVAFALGSTLEDGHISQRGGVAGFNGNECICDDREEYYGMVDCLEQGGAEEVICNQHRPLRPKWHWNGGAREVIHDAFDALANCICLGCMKRTFDWARLRAVEVEGGYNLIGVLEAYWVCGCILGGVENAIDDQTANFVRVHRSEVLAKD